MRIPTIFAITTFILFLAALCAVVAGKKYCGNELNRMVAKTCVFPGETQPCLGSSAMTNSNVQQECCQKGCDLKTIQKMCCFTEKCLNDCYPGKGHKMGIVY
jgi:succinylglutamate desuccinylase